MLENEQADRKAAYALLEKACFAGQAQGCLMLSDKLRQRAEGNNERYLDLLQRACKADEDVGCLPLVSFLLNWGVGEKSYTQARTLSERSCNKGVPAGCGLLAEVVLRKARDDKKFQQEGCQIALKACELKDETSCELMAGSVMRSSSAIASPRSPRLPCARAGRPSSVPERPGSSKATWASSPTPPAHAR